MEHLKDTNGSRGTYGERRDREPYERKQKPRLDALVPSERELRALAVIGAEPRAVQGLGETLEMTRQGAHGLLTRLRERSLVRRETVDETHRYQLARRPVVLDREIVERPGRAKVFVCMRFTDA